MPYDICIIGAGIAGLYCARELVKKHQGKSIVILEKYGSIGGRVVTFKKSVPGVGNVQWENGAGRVHESHQLTLDLLKEYKLNVIPLHGEIMWKPSSAAVAEPVSFGMYLENMSSIKALQPDVLEAHTLKGLFEKTVGKKEAKALLDCYEYRSELDTLRADKALESLSEVLGSHKGFFVVKEGFSALVGALKRDIEAMGVKILREHVVTNLEKIREGYKISLKAQEPIRASKVIVAVHRDALAEIPCFKGHPLLKQVKMRPLVRMYAVFPKTNAGIWFTGMPSTVCPAPIRYIIPIDPTRGIVMISYTDGKDAEQWLRLLESKGESGVEADIMKELRALFPTLRIPDPVFFKVHPWYDGCSYWTPGHYSIEKASKAALQPFPDSMPDVYMCGESWASDQCWVNSALEHAAEMLRLI